MPEKRKADEGSYGYPDIRHQDTAGTSNEQSDDLINPSAHSKRRKGNSGPWSYPDISLETVPKTNGGLHYYQVPDLMGNIEAVGGQELAMNSSNTDFKAWHLEETNSASPPLENAPLNDRNIEARDKEQPFESITEKDLAAWGLEHIIDDQDYNQASLFHADEKGAEDKAPFDRVADANATLGELDEEDFETWIEAEVARQDAFKAAIPSGTEEVCENAELDGEYEIDEEFLPRPIAAAASAEEFGDEDGSVKAESSKMAETRPRQIKVAKGFSSKRESGKPKTNELKGSDGRPKGQVQVVDGALSFKEPNKDKWRPAVYHYQLRAQYIELTEQLGKNEFPDECGQDPIDVTTYHPDYENWGSERDNRPGILFQFERKGYPVPNYYPGVLMDKGRVVIDQNNHAVKAWTELPLCCSLQMPGYKMEAIRRLNMNITLSDIMARMPYIANPSRKDFNRLSMRMTRFRQKGCCISWVEREGGEQIKDYMIHLIGPICKAANSTVDFGRDLTDAEIKAATSANKGNYPKRARRINRQASSDMGEQEIDENMAPKRRKTGAATSAQIQDNRARHEGRTQAVIEAEISQNVASIVSPLQNWKTFQARKRKRNNLSVLEDEESGPRTSSKRVHIQGPAEKNLGYAIQDHLVTQSREQIHIQPGSIGSQYPQLWQPVNQRDIGPNFVTGNLRPAMVPQASMNPLSFSDAEETWLQLNPRQNVGSDFAARDILVDIPPAALMGPPSRAKRPERSERRQISPMSFGLDVFREEKISPNDCGKYVIGPEIHDEDLPLPPCRPRTGDDRQNPAEDAPIYSSDPNYLHESWNRAVPGGTRTETHPQTEENTSRSAAREQSRPPQIATALGEFDSMMQSYIPINAIEDQDILEGIWP